MSKGTSRALHGEKIWRKLPVDVAEVAHCHRIPPSLHHSHGMPESLSPIEAETWLTHHKASQQPLLCLS